MPYCRPTRGCSRRWHVIEAPSIQKRGHDLEVVGNPRGEARRLNPRASMVLDLLTSTRFVVPVHAYRKPRLTTRLVALSSGWPGPRSARHQGVEHGDFLRADAADQHAGRLPGWLSRARRWTWRASGRDARSLPVSPNRGQLEMLRIPGSTRRAGNGPRPRLRRVRRPFATSLAATARNAWGVRVLGDRRSTPHSRVRPGRRTPRGGAPGSDHDRCLR